MFSLTGYFLDAVTLFCYFCKNIIHQTDQLFFKDGNQPDENDNDQNQFHRSQRVFFLHKSL
jgi:hypothetical protein